MRDLDETDRELLRLLLDDGRAPYSALAEAVDLSPPAVSDRIDRLEELGVIERFTVNVDRSRLHDGVRLAVTLGVTPGETTAVREALAEVTGVEHVFATADSRVFVVGTFADGDIESALAPVFGTDVVETIDATPLVSADWHPALGERRSGWSASSAATASPPRASPRLSTATDTSSVVAPVERASRSASRSFATKSETSERVVSCDVDLGYHAISAAQFGSIVDGGFD